MSDIVGNKPELAEYLDPVSDDQSKLSLYLIGYMEYHTGYRATDMGCNTG